MNQQPPENTWPIPLVDNAFFVDNSAQERMQTCSRSAGYYIGHKRELNRSRSALAFGKIIHKVLEKRYLEHGNYLDAGGVSAMVKVADAEFSQYQPEGDDFRNYGVAVNAIKKYADQYAIEDFEIVKLPDGSLFVERPFAIPLGTITINGPAWVRNPDGTIVQRDLGTIVVVQKGKIDLTYRRDGALYGLDHKTTSIMGSQFFAEFELASQIHGYSWAISKLVGELPRGFVINGLGIRKPTPSGKPLEFVRQTIPIYPALVAEWQTDTLQIVAEFIEGCRTNALPKETKWCVGKYGPCEFKQVCGLEPHLRMQSLYSNEYRDVTWDPLQE
jgi:PD-(D/E)XK nuclease superfamily